MSIKLENVSYSYSPGGPFEVRALVDCSLEVQQGEFIGLIGHTGSGKSTLVQHMNALIKPTLGRVTVDGIDVTRTRDLREVRRRVGLVFQYPEYQLFEETVGKDVGFGPRNLGLDEAQIAARVRRALEGVGLAADDIMSRSPFELSGGQKRRVAIAGVLAMEPSYLILDEPTAGLDPRGRKELLQRITDLQRKRGVAVILVSHNMEEIASLASRIVVMHSGRIVMDGSPAEVFDREAELSEIGLSIPDVSKIGHFLVRHGVSVPKGLIQMDTCVDLLERVMRGDA